MLAAARQLPHLSSWQLDGVSKEEFKTSYAPEHVALQAWLSKYSALGVVTRQVRVRVRVGVRVRVRVRVSVRVRVLVRVLVRVRVSGPRRRHAAGDLRLGLRLGFLTQTLTPTLTVTLAS